MQLQQLLWSHVHAKQDGKGGVLGLNARLQSVGGALSGTCLPAQQQHQHNNNKKQHQQVRQQQHQHQHQLTPPRTPNTHQLYLQPSAPRTDRPSTDHPHIIYRSSTDHPQIIHISSTDHAQIIYRSSTDHLQIIHRSSTDHDLDLLGQIGS